MLLVKKYPNRRLYDTRSSRYITLDDLEKLVRSGEDVMIQDAQDGRDLTQETLTQIILDRGQGRILPTSLLLRLIRLDDEALGEFLTRYVGWALEVYVQAKHRARALLPLNPLATAPFAATDALARLVLGASQWGANAGGNVPPPPAPGGGPEIEIPPPPVAAQHDDLPPPPPPVGPGALSGAALAGFGAADVTDEMLRLRHEIEALKASLGAPAGRARRGGKPGARRVKAASKSKTSAPKK